jgi:hypothetical protein
MSMARILRYFRVCLDDLKEFRRPLLLLCRDVGNFRAVSEKKERRPRARRAVDEVRPKMP